MCGIFGWSFAKDAGPSKAKRAILGYSLASENDDRGGHSWGSLVITPGGDPKIRKGMGKMHHSAYGMGEFRLAFGHTRFATTGAQVVGNSHPFEIGNIIGAHNGMIYNHTFLNNYYEREFEVDSQHIFGHLRDGYDFAELEGYGTIEFVRKENPYSIYLAQLRSGELSIYGIKSRGVRIGVVWSSLEYDVVHSLKAAGIRDFFEYEVEEGRLYQASEGNLFRCEEKLELSAGTISTIERNHYQQITSGRSTGWGEDYRRGWERSFEAQEDRIANGYQTCLMPYGVVATPASDDGPVTVGGNVVIEDTEGNLPLRVKDARGEYFDFNNMTAEDMADWLAYCRNDDASE